LASDITSLKSLTKASETLMGMLDRDMGVMMETTLEHTDVELTNRVLAETRFDVRIEGPMADNLLAAIHPNNWNSHNSQFLKTQSDRRNYIMAVLDVVDNPICHTAKVVESAVDVYHEKGGEAPENFVAASAAYWITARFLFQNKVEQAIAQDIEGNVQEPDNHQQAVAWEKNGYDIVGENVTYQVKTGKGTETDSADVRINASIDGKTIRYEME
jgi:hypothetical protein